jgi:hypothetical protein
MRECTRGSEHLIYVFKGMKNILDEQEIISLPNGKQITYDYIIGFP